MCRSYRRRRKKFRFRNNFPYSMTGLKLIIIFVKMKKNCLTILPKYYNWEEKKLCFLLIKENYWNLLPKTHSNRFTFFCFHIASLLKFIWFIYLAFISPSNNHFFFASLCWIRYQFKYLALWRLPRLVHLALLHCMLSSHNTM